jgi:hypothetical protein
MKRPVRVPSQISESLHKRLSAYTLAASAAGVSMFALAHPADAKIIYTPANINILRDQHYYLEINHDGVRDFKFVNRFYSGLNTSARLTVSPVNQQNQVWGTGEKRIQIASALSSGIRIGATSSKFQSGRHFMRLVFTTHTTTQHYFTYGPWNNVQDRYLGLKFIVKGEIHYGWARLNVVTGDEFVIKATLTGYAYETIPNKPIIAGKTHGKDEATLGRLAQGASGVRQKQ